MGKRFSNGHRYDNFEPEEFFCPCCGIERMQHSTMSKAEELRHRYGKRLNIADGGGYRCEKYGSETSAHCDGRAFDPLYPRDDHFELMRLAFEIGFTGIGDKQKDGKYKMHLDDAQEITGARPRPRKWTY